MAPGTGYRMARAGRPGVCMTWALFTRMLRVFRAPSGRLRQTGGRLAKVALLRRIAGSRMRSGGAPLGA